MKINGKKVIKIKNGETKTVEIEQNHANIQIKQTGTKSNKLIVSEGDSIEIDMKKWMRWQPLIVGIVVFISSMLTRQIESSIFFENWNVFAVAGLVGLTAGTIVGLPYLFFDSYELNKVEC